VFRHHVHDEGMALAYITDCTLATVCALACKKSPPKGELARQVSVAQTAIDWMRAFGTDFSTTRAADVVEKAGGSVQRWSERFRPQASESHSGAAVQDVA
jgi:hypothetical protein